jgi:hypothetical protein
MKLPLLYLGIKCWCGPGSQGFWDELLLALSYMWLMQDTEKHGIGLVQFETETI